jgi:hypothetical protein
VRTGLALKIVAGKLERVPDAPVQDLEWLQAQVGGYIECGLTSDYGGRDRIMVWCNEEGHLTGMAPNVRRVTDGWPLVGPLVVTGCTAAGNNRGLTKAEEKRVVLLESPDSLPVLSILPKRGA